MANDLTHGPNPVITPSENRSNETNRFSLAFRNMGWNKRKNQRSMESYVFPKFELDAQDTASPLMPGKCSVRGRSLSFGNDVLEAELQSSPGLKNNMDPPGSMSWGEARSYPMHELDSCTTPAELTADSPLESPRAQTPPFTSIESSTV